MIKTKKKSTAIYRCYIFLFLGLALGCAWYPKAKELTELENQYLESFFKYLFENTTAGYVLYGERPIFYCAFKSVENTIPGTAEHRDAVLFTQGLNTWKQLNIQVKNYLLVFFTSNEAKSFQEFILINKKAFEDIVRKNLSLFQCKLGSQVNEQNLLDSILSTGFSSLFKCHEALQGILFGYGVENSLTYERGNALRKKALGSSKINPPFQSANEPITPDELKERIIHYVASQGNTEQNLLEELSDFSFYTPESEDEITPKIPFSFHLKSEESKNLLAAYKESERTVINLQSQKNFVEKILKRLKQ
ncbi:MAG: hypothetical protein AABZ92_07190 [Verrucomicrobiota bacterium]